MNEVDLYPGAVSAQELENARAETAKTITDLYSAREAVVRKIVGKKVYKEAIDLLGLVTAPEPEPENVDKEIAALVGILGQDLKQVFADEMHDLLQLEPSNDEEEARKEEATQRAKVLYPDEEILYLLDKPEKLALLGALLDEEITMFDVISEEEPVKQLFEARDLVDKLITKIYSENTHMPEGCFLVEVSDIHFRVTLNVSEEVVQDIIASELTNFEKEAKIAALNDYKNISLMHGVLTINGKPASTRADLQEIASILNCVPEIVKDLKKAQKKIPKKA